MKTLKYNKMSSYKNIEKQAVRNVNLKMLEGKHTGQVKWFNRRRGYGFIKILKSEESEEDFIGKDIFVHQSHISPKQSTYRSLEENEYVEFSLSLDDRNTTQAVNVTGIMNGTLLCDAHAEKQKYNLSQLSNNDSNGSSEPQSFNN